MLILEQLTSFLETGPILWIPSKIWFPFLSRRLSVLYEAHGKLWTKFPSNYGVVSGLFTFLMQSVIFTPPMITSYVRETLAALNFKRNCSTFGMFFVEMKDMERPWLIDDLPEVDMVDVVRELKLTVTRRRQPLAERREVEDESRYPLGEAPTLRQVTASLQSDPTILIPRWEEPAELPESMGMNHAAEIFIRFTCHIWILLNPSWRTRPERRIDPRTVQEALRCWSVDAVREEILTPMFKPCHSGLDAGAGRPSSTFQQRRKMYFPDDSQQVMTKTWKFLGNPPGYISKYRQKKRRLEAEVQRELDECLGDLLSLCQCLPDSSRSASAGYVWRIERKQIVILTNRKYYKLRKIGKKPSQRTGSNEQGPRAPPAHRNARSTMISLMVHDDVPMQVAEQEYQASRRRKGSDKRSAKTRNRRKPPVTKRTMIIEEEDTEDDDQTESDSDDEVRESGGSEAEVESDC